MKRASPRGQGTLELALGALVFLSVLMFGIHFAEVGMMKLRVQQAATAALWDTTGVRMHRFNTAPGTRPDFYTSNQMLDAEGRRPDQRAEVLFRDFEGLSEGGSSAFTQVMTRGSRLDVRCTPAPVSPLPGGEAFDRLRVAYAPPRSGGQEVDGMECNARARLEVWGMPTSFFERRDRGLFTEAHVRTPRIPVCAFGRATGGECRGSVPIALDDWALSGSRAGFGRELESCGEACLFDGTGNQAYKRTVERLYDEYNAFETRDFSIPYFIRRLFTADPVVPALSNVPVDERDFRMVFVGEEGEGTGRDATQPFHYRTREQDTTRAYDFEWATTPYADAYKTAHERRRACFLGSPCDRSLFDKGGW